MPNNYRASYTTKPVEYKKEKFDCPVIEKIDENGKPVEDEFVNLVNDSQAENCYRKKYRIPFPDEIKAIREQYGVSAIRMSQILGFGDNQYRLYESGLAMPSVSNGRIIHSIINSPGTFDAYLESAREQLGEEIYLKIRRQIEEAHIKPVDEIRKNDIERMFGDKYYRNEYNGYTAPAYDKLKNILLYYIEQMGGVFHTKMNKLLFYTDFLFYKKHQKGITGLAYSAIQYGPVPKNSFVVYSLMEGLRQELYRFENTEVEGTKLFSAEGAYSDMSIFSDEEMEVINDVANRFRGMSATEISHESHNEQAWLQNQENRQLISYCYAAVM